MKFEYLLKRFKFLNPGEIGIAFDDQGEAFDPQGTLLLDRQNTQVFLRKTDRGIDCVAIVDLGLKK